ncbi:hypothetical protein J3R83DRAFT_1154 [Lanmaoa asiatica]|nr:hypothetical protein J3R83DRAFT_1154 [Lanmaoa asiatica]
MSATLSFCPVPLPRTPRNIPPIRSQIRIICPNTLLLFPRAHPPPSSSPPLSLSPPPPVSLALSSSSSVPSTVPSPADMSNYALTLAPPTLSPPALPPSPPGPVLFAL